MKSQFSLEVPKQIRSISFDEILQVKQDDSRPTCSSSSMGTSARLHDLPIRRGSTTLKVPEMSTGQRSKSFDAYPTSSGSSSGSQQFLSGFEVSGCYHCVCVEQYKKLNEYPTKDDVETDGLYGEVDNDADRSGNESEREDEPRREGSPEIRVTLMTSDDVQNDEQQCIPLPGMPEPNSEIRVEFPERQRRLSRQEALTSFPLDLSTVLGAKEEKESVKVTAFETEDDDDDEDNDVHEACNKPKFIVRDIFLTVPELKRDRAASVDSCFNNKNGSGIATDTDSLAAPQQNIRSKSVDIVLPTDARTRYTALLPEKIRRPSIGCVRIPPDG